MKSKSFSLFFALIFGSGIMNAAVQIGYLNYNLEDSNYTAEVATNYCGQLMNYCGVKSIEIPSTIVYNKTKYTVTSLIEYAFWNADDLVSVILPHTITNIGFNAFASNSLMSIEVAENNSHFSSDSGILFNKEKSSLIKYPRSKTNSSYKIPSSVSEIKNSAFSDCKNLTSIDIPDSVVSIETSAFYHCENLTSLKIPQGVTRIEQGICSYCYNLTSIELPDSASSIASYAFEGCVKLSSIKIPQGVTSIGMYAFCNCSGLQSITLPKSVTSIGQHGFQGCTSLTYITCEAIVPPELIGFELFDVKVFDGIDKSIPLFVPAESVSAYKKANGWKDFTNIQAIPECESYLFTDSMKLCRNEETIWRNHEIRFNDIDTTFYHVVDSLVTNKGCDSIYELYVQFLPTYDSISYDTIVEGEILRWRNKNLTKAGTYRDTLISSAGCDSIFALHLTTIPVSQRELSGYFSTSPSSKIHFSQGNLQYRASTDTWRFADQQYDYIGNTIGNISGDNRETQDSWIDLYGWGTGNNPTICSSEYKDYSNFNDWGANTIINGNEYNWRTLTYEEWWYIFYTRKNANYLRGQATVNNVHGYILLPDNWENLDGLPFVPNPNNWTSNVYTAAQWDSMEKAGAVFFPCAGSRTTTRFSDQVGGYYYPVNNTETRGNYWSASWFYNAMYANSMNFQVSEAGIDAYGRECGFSVRLVRDVEIFHITLICNNDLWGYVTGDTISKDVVTITATPNYGYHFIQWNDGITDNPRTFVVTQDTTFTAEFAVDRTGTCGTDLALTWTYDPEEKVLTISGTGAFNDNMQCGVEARTALTKVEFAEGVTAIGTNAFANCETLQTLVLGKDVKKINENAFFSCENLTTIYNYRPTPANAYSTSFDGVDKFECILYVQEASLDLYKNAFVWRDFYYTQALPETQTAIDEISNEQSPITNKVIRDGHLLIHRGDKTYTITGSAVKY